MVSHGLSRHPPAPKLPRREAKSHGDAAEDLGLDMQTFTQADRRRVSIVMDSYGIYSYGYGIYS